MLNCCNGVFWSDMLFHEIHPLAPVRGGKVEASQENLSVLEQRKV